MADVPPNIQDIYTTGRYYTGNDAEFTSREIDFNFERGLGTSGTDADPVNVFMVHWTVYGTKTTVDDGTMPNGKVDVELNSKTLTLPDNGAAVSPTATGQPFAPSDNKMRYKLLFKPTTNNQPAIDTIMLDDITFYYYATPKIVSWRYEQ